MLDKLTKHRTVLGPDAPELSSQPVKISRVSKTTKGGRNFHFTAKVIAGNGAGVVGFGLGKASDVARAIQKGVQAASRNLYSFPLRDQRTLYHEVRATYKGTEVAIFPGAPGTGNVAGASVRIILDKLGVSDSLAKIHGSTNPQNVVKATFLALAQLRSPAQIAKIRGIPLDKVFNG